MTDMTSESLFAPRPTGAMRWLTGGLGVMLSGYAAAMYLLYQRQESLIFEPETLPADFSLAGHYAAEPHVEEFCIAVPDGELSALLFRQPGSRGLLFYLHGNSGNLATWSGKIADYRKLGLDLFMLDYRGFGKSRGRIESEAQLHADVRAAWEHIAPRYAGQPAVIVGRSLGSGLAVHLARDVSPALLVLVTPYASMLRLAREKHPLVPSAVLKYPLRSDHVIAKVSSPMLLVHGDGDKVIPLDHARDLHARAGTRAELLIVEGAGHGDIHSFPIYLDILSARIADALPS